MRPLLAMATAAAALAAAGVPAVSPAEAQEIVFDPSRAADFIQEFAKIEEQLATAKSALAQAQQMYGSVTGSRGFGDLFRTGNLEQYFPGDARALYDGSGGGAGITSSLAAIQEREQSELSGATADVRSGIEQREQSIAATEEALAERAYDGAKQRLAQIEALMDEIQETQDPKGIAELQARIAAEQAAIQIELNKLTIVARLEEAKEKQLAEEKRALARRILDPANQGMPSIATQ